MVPNLKAQGRAFSQPDVDAASKVAGGRATTLASGEIPRDADEDKRIDPATGRAAPKVLGRIPGTDPCLVCVRSPMRISGLDSYAEPLVQKPFSAEA